MKRSRFPRRTQKTPDVDALCQLARALDQSSCRQEDTFWASRLTALTERLLQNHDEETLNAALDFMYQSEERGYESLIDTIESLAESPTSPPGTETVLIAAPVLAWSRYGIPSGALSPEITTNLRVQIQAHTLAKDAQLTLAAFLFSPDQLPQSYSETRALAQRLSQRPQQDKAAAIDPADLPETMQFLSDTRYLLGTITVPTGSAMFRWQEEDGDRAESLRHWRNQGGEALNPALQACAFELLLPLPYHAACRAADRQSRPYSIEASVAFLNTTLNNRPDQLRAIIAPFHDRRLEEYRIGLTLVERPQVIHGIVWPLLEAEDETSDIASQIEAVLKQAGVQQILQLEQRFPMEYCDDCGTPLYPNPEGEPVHAEMPDESTMNAPRHLH